MDDIVDHESYSDDEVMFVREEMEEGETAEEMRQDSGEGTSIDSGESSRGMPDCEEGDVVISEGTQDNSDVVESERVYHSVVDVDNSVVDLDMSDNLDSDHTIVDVSASDDSVLGNDSVVTIPYEDENALSDSEDESENIGRRSQRQTAAPLELTYNDLGDPVWERRTLR